MRDARTRRPLHARLTRLALSLFTLALASGLGIAAGRPIEGQRRREPPLSSMGPSAVIYPPSELAVRMSHAEPAHAALPCARCHEAAATSVQSQDLLLPREASCVACHAETDRAQPSVERCGLCHVGARLPSSEADAPDLVGRIYLPSSRVPPPRLRFSHASHVSSPGSCEGCHGDVRGVSRSTRALLPTMRDCMRCHAIEGLATPGRGTSREAQSAMACTGCHESLPDGRVRAQVGEDWMNPPSWMAGMRHDHDWLVRHRWVAADAGPLCAQCHVERECTDCHDGRVRPRRVHPGDFLTTHAVMARRDETRCTSCHAVGTFCSECHARLGLATFSAPATRGAGRYHPPSAVWIRGPNQHGIEARRSLQSCVTCHGEDDCVVCHGSNGVGGGGVSPHPPGFAASCASILGSTPAACIRCHGDVETLRTRCR